jgi:hypothetical protein
MIRKFLKSKEEKDLFFNEEVSHSAYVSAFRKLGNKLSRADVEFLKTERPGCFRIRTLRKPKPSKSFLEKMTEEIRENILYATTSKTSNFKINLTLTIDPLSVAIYSSSVPAKHGKWLVDVETLRYFLNYSILGMARSEIVDFSDAKLVPAVLRQRFENGLIVLAFNKAGTPGTYVYCKGNIVKLLDSQGLAMLSAKKINDYVEHVNNLGEAIKFKKMYANRY